MSNSPVRIATRGSQLAIAQAQAVLIACRARFPDVAFEIKIIKTTGDKLQSASLANSNLPKGLFTKELETALLQGQAHLAVHSLKDLPTELPSGLALGAVTQREDVRDVLIYRDARHPHSQGRAFGGLTSITDLPQAANLATSSTRRAAQARLFRPDIRIQPVRGNVPTRINKLLTQPEVDVLILAAAGLNRLGYAIADDGSLQLGPPGSPAGLMATPLAVDEMLPCVGQGAVAIEISEENSQAATLCAGLNDLDTDLCVAAERALLRALGGGCQMPLGAYARREAGTLHLQAVLLIDSTPRRAQATGTDPDTLGRQVATLLRK